MFVTGNIIQGWGTKQAEENCIHVQKMNRLRTTLIDKLCL